MSLDDIIAQLRELAANATRAAKSPAACSDKSCAHAYRAMAMAARFTELDAAMSNRARLPKTWATMFVPSQRDPH